MNSTDYTPEQRKEVEERVNKAAEILKEMHLNPACVLQMSNIGEDNFAVKPFVYLQDTLYTPKKSPIQPENI